MLPCSIKRVIIITLSPVCIYVQYAPGQFMHLKENWMLHTTMFKCYHTLENITPYKLLIF